MSLFHAPKNGFHIPHEYLHWKCLSTAVIWFHNLPCLPIQHLAILYHACHKYECVKNDIIHWLPFVKKIMSGHDYYPDIDFCNRHPHIKGVKLAVEEMLGLPDKRYDDSSWLIYKK